MVHKVVLQKGESINGQRYCVVSFIGPTMRQKHEVYGIKVYCAVEDRESAEVLALKIREKEEVYDVYVMDTNAWAALDVSPDDVKDQRFADELLDEMLHKQKENHEKAEREFQEKVSDRKNAIRQELSEEGQRQRSEEKESPVAVLFKIKQYKDLIEHRTKELAELQRVYVSEYSESERSGAENMPMPQTQPEPMSLTLYDSTPRD